MRALFRLFGRFRRDQSANVAVIFGIACVPLITAIGCAVDYSQATRIRAKLQSAADAAAVAAISQKSPGFIAAAAMSGNGTVTAGGDDANRVFDGNMSQLTGITPTRTSTVTKTGVKLTAYVQSSADVPTTFMSIWGTQKRHGNGQLKCVRVATALSRFLSHAGPVGIDGVAIDRRRANAAVPGQPG